MPTSYQHIMNEAPTYTTLQNVAFSQSPEYFGNICGLNAFIPGHEMNIEESRPFLVIIEEPADTFRYRYKSEKGSHGGIKGASSLNPRAKKSFPTVKLENCNPSLRKKIKIRASLYTNETIPKPHVYELTGKNCSEGKCETTLDENFMAIYQSLAISTRKKEEVLETLKQRKISEFDSAEISYKDAEVEAEAQDEMKGINLDSAKLCFEAFLVDDKETLLCEKIFSKPINNQKSAASGDLRIVRFSRCSGKCSGGDEVFLLCEKVNKGDVKVHFFEEHGEDAWEGYGEFNPAEVHHQVAIVFKTPKYRQTNVHRKVSFELFRPSDGKRSEPREFTYIPDNDGPPSKKLIDFQTASLVKEELSGIDRKRKRPKLEKDTIGSENYLNCSSLDSPESMDDEQTCLMDINKNENILKDIDWNQLLPDLLGVYDGLENTKEEEEYSESLFACDLLFPESKIVANMGLPVNSVVADSAMNEISLTMDSLSLSDQSCAQESNSQKKVKASQDFINGMNTILQNREATTYLHYAPHLIPMEDENGNSMLHLAILEQNGNWNFIMKLLQVVSEDLMNKKNKFQETPLHLAVKGNHLKILLLLLTKGANPNLQNGDGNNCLHLAAKYGHINCLKILMLPFERKMKFKHEITDIDAFNYDGMSALHIAVTRNFGDIVNFLLKCKADVNLPEKKCGRTSFHLAIEQPSLLHVILQQPELDINAQDFRGYTGIQLACIKTGKSFEVVSAQLKDSKGEIIQFFKNINWNEEECDSRCTEVGSYGDSTDSSDFEDAVEDLSSVSGIEVICKTVPAAEQTIMHEKKSCLMKTEELQKYLDTNDNWKKLADLIGLNTECVAMLDEGLSPGFTVIKKIQDMHYPCDSQTIIEHLRIADLEEGAQILEGRFSK